MDLLINDSLQIFFGSRETTIGAYLEMILAGELTLCPYITSQESSSGLFKPGEFTPYDPTQDAIFPPELMVS